MVVIDHVVEDRVFHSHPTPAMYGFQSYISQPIILPDDNFSAPCAPSTPSQQVEHPPVLGMFKLFADWSPSISTPI